MDTSVFNNCKPGLTSSPVSKMPFTASFLVPWYARCHLLSTSWAAALPGLILKSKTGKVQQWEKWKRPGKKRIWRALTWSQSDTTQQAEHIVLQVDHVYRNLYLHVGCDSPDSNTCQILGQIVPLFQKQTFDVHISHGQKLTRGMRYNDFHAA